jgi:hypothetical protein
VQDDEELAEKIEGLTDDPGSTADSVLLPANTPYRIGSESEATEELPLEPPKNRREAFLMAKTMLSGGRGRLTPLRADEIMATADWLLGIDAQIEERPDTPPNIFNPPTASAYEPVRRQRPSGLAFLYLHPPCFTVGWREATEVLQPCMTEGCTSPTTHWLVLYREKNA